MPILKQSSLEKKVNLGDGKGMKDMFVEDLQEKANVRYIDTSQKYNKLNLPFFQATQPTT